MEYVPTGTDANVKYPSLFDVVSRAEPDSASRNTILALATTPPEGSDTTPVSVAKIPCPHSDPPAIRTNPHTHTRRENMRFFTDSPLLSPNNDILNGETAIGSIKTLDARTLSSKNYNVTVNATPHSR